MSETGSAQSRDVLEARERLTALLEAAYGSAEEARAALERALRRSSRSEFPTSIPDVLAFVRAGLIPVLSDDLGPRLTMTVLEDFIAQHEIRSSVRAKRSAAAQTASHVEVRARGAAQQRRLRALLVDSDRIGRAALARALVRDSCQVTVVDSLEELGQVVRGGDDVDVAILDSRHPAKLLILELIVDRFPKASLVVRSAGEAATRALIQALDVERFEVLPCDVSPEAVLAAVQRIAR